MGHNPKVRHKQADSNPDSLCSGITIFLLTIRSSRTCSHQYIDDNYKERKPHTNNQTSKG